jgi:hypothetical protein
MLSPTLREQYELRVVGKRVPREIFGPKTGGTVGGWGKLHYEELHNL